MIGYAPHYNDVKGYPGAPRFFARIVDLGQSFIASLDEQGRPKDVSFMYPPNTPLEIIGFAVMSNYPEDKRIEKAMWEQRRQFMGWCFSRIEPQGEIGFVPLDECREINEAELLNALRAYGHNL